MSIEASPELKQEIKELIVSTLKIDDIKPEEIPDDDSLFEDNGVIKLDSIDALEIVVALQKQYGVRIDNQNLARFIIKSVNTISEFIAKEQEKEKASLKEKN
jgi:acyl carrier protein